MSDTNNVINPLTLQQIENWATALESGQYEQGTMESFVKKEDRELFALLRKDRGFFEEADEIVQGARDDDISLRRIALFREKIEARARRNHA